jgi:hypothetical protein
LKLSFLFVMSLALIATSACSAGLSETGSDTAESAVGTTYGYGATDAGSPDASAAIDATADVAVDAAPIAPAPFTKTEMQTFVNTRCTPCHIANAPAGLSLANDFTTATVGVPATELPTMFRIAPGDREKSYLFHKIRGTHVAVGGTGARMPKNNPPLADADIARIGGFIDGL